ncbi:MAG: hypothetical protein HUU18_08155 [Phycisphaerales bacterium]|nr:hypothetical protein [Phycisphaerales bacterium]
MNSGTGSAAMAAVLGAIFGLIIGAVIASLIAAIFLKMAVSWVAKERAEYGRCFSTTLMTSLLWAACVFFLVSLREAINDARVPYVPLAKPSPLVLLIYPALYGIHSLFVAYRLEITLGKALLAAFIQSAMVLMLLVVLIAVLFALK